MQRNISTYRVNIFVDMLKESVNGKDININFVYDLNHIDTLVFLGSSIVEVFST